MANYTRGAKKAAAARKGHRKNNRRKKSAGSRKGAWARWRKRGRKPRKNRR